MARILTVQGLTPKIHDEAFISKTAVVAGNVRIGRKSSLWYGTVVRSEEADVVVGDESSLEDLSVVSTDPGSPVRIGNRVTIGHGAVIHGCTIEDDVQVGMNAIILNGATIGEGAVVAAGSMVDQGTVVPPGTLAVGVPADVCRRPVTDAARATVDNDLDSVELHRAAIEDV